MNIIKRHIILGIFSLFTNYMHSIQNIILLLFANKYPAELLTRPSSFLVCRNVEVYTINYCWTHAWPCLQTNPRHSQIVKMCLHYTDTRNESLSSWHICGPIFLHSSFQYVFLITSEDLTGNLKPNT